MNEFTQTLFALKTLNDLYTLDNGNDVILNAIEIVHKSSYSYMLNDNFYSTVSSVNSIVFSITHNSVVYKCRGVNGPRGKITITSIDTSTKYNG
jgi:hypothetical protein